MMISWPPIPGPTVGYKQSVHLHFNDTVQEDLSTLGGTEWWTGVHIGGLLGDRDSPTLVLQLVDREDNLVGTPWRQDIDNWVPLPWALPADLARIAGLRLKITTIDVLDAPIPINIQVAFETIEPPPDASRFIFTNGEGRPVLYWNSHREAWGDRFRFAEPPRNRPHIQVPQVDTWITWNSVWVNDWDERVQLIRG